MPCVTYDETPREIEQLRKEVDQLSGWLCDACIIINEEGLNLPEALQAWFDVHTARETEKIRVVALSKLTKRERKALGF